jgi:hypothetical protein
MHLPSKAQRLGCSMRGLVIVMAVGEGLGSWDLQGALMRRQLEKNESHPCHGREDLAGAAAAS